MKVSKLWLDKFFNAPLPAAGELSEALTFHVFEIDGIERINGDEVLDVKVTPNRGHDCLSHRGIAKELSAILKLPLAHDPFNTTSDISKKTAEVSVTIENPRLCRRYIAGYVKGVKVGPSPRWLTDRLEAIGQRSINNVVDTTNFVMFNTGQPLHAFDAGKLKESGGFAIEVRNARPGEKLTALDGKAYSLSESMLVIADKNKNEAIGIAGVKGGMPAAITEATKDIIIESANFDGASVRKAAQALKLRTDASQRFEQELAPELAACGMEGMMEFVAHLLGGEVAGFVDVYPSPQEQKTVSMSAAQAQQILGLSITPAHISDAFTRLQLPYKEEDGVFEMQPPFERLDITRAEDLVEEVARIVGYDKIPAAPLPPSAKAPEINKNFYAAERAREELAAQGYDEVITSVFADKGERAVLNKVDSVRPYLRSTLVDGLQDALKKNIPNKDLLGLKEIKLFEIGTVWKGGEEVAMLGTVSEKEGMKEAPLEPADADAYEHLPLSKAERFKPFSKYPYIVRDIAMWLPAGTQESEVLETIKKEAGELCIRIDLFDRFEKAEKVSLAYRLIFQSFERTLTEVEVNKIMETVSEALKQKGFEIR